MARKKLTDEHKVALADLKAGLKAKTKEEKKGGAEVARGPRPVTRTLGETIDAYEKAAQVYAALDADDPAQDQNRALLSDVLTDLLSIGKRAIALNASTGRFDPSHYQHGRLDDVKGS